MGFSEPCRSNTSLAVALFSVGNRGTKRMFLRRENTNLRIVSTFCNIEQQAAREETEALRAAIASKELEKAALLQRAEADRQNQQNGEEYQ